MRALPLALAVTLLLLPSALAAQRLGGEARGEGAPTLDATGALAAAEGVLDLTGPARDGTLRLAWSSALGERTTQRGTLTAGTYYDGEEAEATPVAWPAGSLAAFRCGDGCVVRLEVAGRGEAGLSGHVAGGPGLAREARLQTQDVPTPGPTVHFVTQVDAQWLVAQARGGAAGYALPLGTPHARGEARLELWNVTATRAWAEGEEEVRAGLTRTPRAAPLGPPVQEDIRVDRLVLDLRDVQVDAPPGSGAVLAAPALHARLDGAASWPSAEGVVVVDGRETPLRGERLDLEGPALLLALARAGPVPGATAALARVDTDARLGGEASSVRVDGREVAHAAAASPAAVAGTAAGAAGVAGLVWLAARLGLWTALYSRVTGTRVLTNPNRLAAYELIVAKPGVHVSEMSRAIGVGRVVLQHHLRMLEAHRLVVSRPLGRIKVYYPSGGSPDATGIRAHAALKDGSRSRVLAEVLAAPGGVTQKEIVERTGLSQRLVSYHLARLEGVLLVQGDGGRPQRFTPGPRAAEAPPRLGA